MDLNLFSGFSFSYTYGYALLVFEDGGLFASLDLSLLLLFLAPAGSGLGAFFFSSLLIGLWIYTLRVAPLDVPLDLEPYDLSERTVLLPPMNLTVLVHALVVAGGFSSSLAQHLHRECLFGGRFLIVKGALGLLGSGLPDCFDFGDGTISAGLRR